MRVEPCSLEVELIPQLGLVNSRSRMQGKKLNRTLVFGVELRRAQLVCKVQIADAALLMTNRHGEKTDDRRMLLGEPAEGRVSANVGDPDGSTLKRSDAQRPNGTWMSTDGGLLLLGHAAEDPGPECPVFGDDDPHRRVLRAGDLPCLVDDVLQHGSQFELAGDGDSRVPNCLEEQMKPAFLLVGDGIRDAEGEDVRAAVERGALLAV